MKKSLLLIAGFVLPLCSQAQITLDYSNAPSIAQCQIPDTTDRIKFNTLPDVSPKANATWDLTTASDSSIYSYVTNYAANSSAFPTATFVIPRLYVINAGLMYAFEAMKDVTNNGIVILGEHIDHQGIPLGSITGNVNDSLVFTNQDIVYNVSEYYIKYPCTMGTKWTDNVKFSTYFNLTVTSSGLNNTPGARKSHRITTNEVKGWGKMRVNDHKGNPTGYTDVLVMDRVETTTDSFFLGGMPAPASLLAAFGLTQGQTVNICKRFFFRAGEYRGLLELRYEDASFTKITEIYKHSQRLKPTSVQTINKEQINIYPNPVTNGSFTVKVDGAHKNMSYQLFNMTGQRVATGALPQNGKVSLHSNLPVGNYVIKLISEDGAYGTQQINIIQ